MSTRPGPEAALQARARRQAGAFTRSQALSFGFSARQIDGRLASAAWSRVLTSIYVASAAPITWLTWAWAGVLSAGPDGAVMGTSAAALRGWLPQTWPIVVALPTDTRRRWPVTKLRLARLELPKSDVTKVGGLPVTTRLRTAADLAHELPLTKAQELIDRLLVLEVIDLPSLTAAVEASTRRGSRQARRLAASAADLAASEAERLCHRIMRAAGLGWFVANHIIETTGRAHKVDLAFVQEKVAIEVQGWAYHRTPERRRADDAKAIDLQLAGWIVLAVTWHDLVERPDYVVSRVRTALAGRSAV